MSDLHDNDELVFASRVFDNNHCFLCGAPLNEENKSEEHVYPHWLQKKYNLWNQQLILLNGTAIPYKNLIIPCCKACNRHMGKTFEKPIETAVSIGYDAFIRLDKQMIFQWLCKLSYGILFKERSLLLDRSSPGKGTILSSADLEKEETLFLFLQAVLTNAKFEGHKPYSLIFFRLHSFEDDPYWASDNPLLRTFFMRMGDIGIIANLMDNGVNEEIFIGDPQMRFLTTQALHPIQFSEICAKFICKSYSVAANPSYMFMLDDSGKPEMILGVSASVDEDNNWSQERYAHVLAHYLKPWGIEFEMLYRDGGLVRTFLWNDDGEFIENLHTE